MCRRGLRAGGVAFGRRWLRERPLGQGQSAVSAAGQIAVVQRTLAMGTRKTGLHSEPFGGSGNHGQCRPHPAMVAAMRPLATSGVL